jgi:maltose alpha-D-glucosyltransferase/alpha-amylase
MGDDLALPERECARTPMQWTAERHGGFSHARRTVRPVIDDPEYGDKRVNVAQQRRDPESLLNWTERVVRMRRECPEISWGSFELLPTGSDEVLAIRYDWRNTSLVTLHNFADARRTARVEVCATNGHTLVDVFDHRHSRADASGAHRIAMEPYGYRWFRVGAADNALDRTAL